MLDIQQIKHLAHLARLKLTPKEEEKYSKELSSVLNYFKKLEEVNTEGIEPMAQSIDLVNIFRDDVIKDCPNDTHDAILDNTPQRSGGYVKVQKIL